MYQIVYSRTKKHQSTLVLKDLAVCVFCIRTHAWTIGHSVSVFGRKPVYCVLDTT